MLHTLQLIVFSLSLVHAADPRTLDIQTASDHFSLGLNAAGTSATINGKPADLSTFKDFLPLLSQRLEDPCPTLSDPADVKIKENGPTRELFFKRQLLREGEGCLQITGDGLDYFPIHRDFLIGGKDGSVNLTSPLIFKVGGQTLFQLVGKPGSWREENSDFLLNWDFFNRFETALKSFSIRARARMSLAKNEPRLVLESGGKTYSFYKIGPTTWALKRPEQDWLEITEDFSFFFDLDKRVTEDRFADPLRVIGDSKADLKIRRQTFDKVKAAWNPNLRNTYFKILLDPNENAEFKSLVLRRLRSHPTLETALTMAKFLPLASEADKKLATQVLKLVDPKGPTYNPDESVTIQQRTLKYWEHWLGQQRAMP